MDNTKFFIPFIKADEKEKVVSGYASTEALDSQGDVVERSAIEEALPAYLGDVDQNTGKFRFGNIREMHQPSAVGKTMSAKLDSKGLFIDAKVVDDNAWKKVEAGVYAGFSIGGRALVKTNNRIKRLKLSEISLVDRPANPEAIFTMVKFDKGEAVDVQKSDDMGFEMPEIPHEEILDANFILQLAMDIRMLLNIFEREKRSTKELEKALENLKKLAIKVLSGEDKKKFDAILYNPLEGDISVEKAYERSLKPEEDKGVDVSKFINQNWAPGYFENLRKVNG